MVSDDAAARIFPIGHCIGPYGGTADVERFFQLRIGPDVVRLSTREFAVWGLAHGAPDRPPDQAWDRHRVVAAAYDAGVADAEGVLTNLLADDVLVEATSGGGAVEFARRHRLLPLMLGLGNSPDEPRVYAAGLIGDPIVLMSSMIYDLFGWAHMYGDLWTACVRAAETAAEVGVADEVATDPGRLLDALVASLHTLLSPNAVCLDVASAG